MNGSNARGSSEPEPGRSRRGSGRPRRHVERASILLVVGLAAIVRIALVDRQTLSVDELFSLAMATGHSLEHPAAVADLRLGDYAELPGAVPAGCYRLYLGHEHPPAGSARVIRAVGLSDTSPPLYYLLLDFWTRAFGTGDPALRLLSVLFAVGAFPFLIHIARWVGGRPPSCRSVFSSRSRRPPSPIPRRAGCIPSPIALVSGV